MKRSIRNLTKILPDCFKREIERGGGKVLHLADVRVKRLSLYIYIYLSTTIAPRRCKRIPKRTITSGWKREAAAVPLRRANNNRPRTTLERGVLSRDEWKEHARGAVCTPGGESFCFRDSELIALSPPRCPDTFPSPPPSCLHPSLAKPKRAREFDERSRAEEIHATETNVA